MVHQIIDQIYLKYRRGKFFPISKQKFIDKIKTNEGFSLKWSLKIEEKLLSYNHRWFLAYNESFDDWYMKNLQRNEIIIPSCSLEQRWDEMNIPKKEITITYNDQKFMCYE